MDGPDEAAVGDSARCDGRRCGTATATARWAPVLPSAGSYDVSVWYPAHANRCTTCTYTITSGGSTFTAVADQTSSGGQWVRLGSYHFDPATTVRVQVTNQVNGTYVQADAVKFEKSVANQTRSGGQWVSLGSYFLDPAGIVHVQITNQANGTYVQADAIKFQTE